jgi:hypothetical protein
MTTSELRLEWEFRRDERLAILCEGQRAPTQAERLMAIREANQAIMLLQEEDNRTLL